MNRKIGLTALVLMALCFSGAGMDVEKFNKGTVKEDWTDDFPLKNKGTFEISGNEIKLSLTAAPQCSRYKCSVEGLPAGKMMYFSFYCSGKGIKSKEGFMGYLRNPKFNFVTSISPAGSGWRWAVGSFEKTLLELRFRVPSDGALDVFFELRGDAGEVVVSDPQILPEKRGDILKNKAPAVMSVLPAEWLKDSVSLLQDIPSTLKINVKADGKSFKNKPMFLAIQHPAFVEIVGIEHRISEKENGYYGFPVLKCVQNSENKHVYQLPDRMVAALQKETVAWDNELYLYMKSKTAAGEKGKLSIQLISEEKILTNYDITASAIGSLPKDRKAAKKFKTVIGYPHTASSSLPEVRRTYGQFWKSLTVHPESYNIHRIDLVSPEIRQEFCETFVPGIMIASTQSLPLFHSLQKMPNHTYPILLDDAGKPISLGTKFPLPSIKYVIEDPDNFLWDKALPEEIRYRSHGLKGIRFVTWDSEPSLLNAGYCEENRKWFAEWAKLSSVPTIQEILSRYMEPWGRFRRMQTEMLFQKMASAMKKHFPEMEFRYCSDPLSSRGEPSTWCSNDPRLSIGKIKVFHNMPYFAGSEYFDIIQTNTKLLGQEQFPLIDPSEFSEGFFRKYTPEKVTQNIIATAALDNSGIGFWWKDCFDGHYLLGIAKGFDAVGEIEDILGMANACDGMKVLPQNCLTKKLNEKSEGYLEYPNLTKQIRFTLHKKENAAAAVILNYNEQNTVIAKCMIPQMPQGRYQVFDALAKKSYGTFSHTDLSDGILVLIPQQQAAVLRITPEQKTISAEITQQNLKEQIQEDLLRLSKGQQAFRNLRSGDSEIRWDTLENGRKIVVRISSDKGNADIEPDTGKVCSLTGRNDSVTKLETFGDLILENVRLERTPAYTLTSSKIENKTASLEFSTMLRAEDGTNPQGFPLDGLKITKKYQLRGNRLDFTLQLQNCSPKKSQMRVQCRLRSILASSVSSVQELTDQKTATLLLLRPGKKLDLPWGTGSTLIPWTTDAVTFPGHMKYIISPEFDAVYFWRSTGVLTAEPTTGQLILPPGESKKMTISVILAGKEEK